MFDFASLSQFEAPYRHWLGKAVSDEVVRAINAAWPEKADSRWIHEQGSYAKKSAILFPKKLPEAAHLLASHMYSAQVCEALSKLTGINLHPDPWFTEGPERPLLGGGLHEIHPGGLLRMHIDFNKHPTGLVRCLNLLIYLNEKWKPEWGGGLSLAGEKSIQPTAGMTAIFETTPESWHGHPEPLACPQGITRRSLALYYYTHGIDAERATTVYRK